MPQTTPAPVPRNATAPMEPATRGATETIIDSVCGFGRGVRDAVFGRSLTPTDIEALRNEARTNEHFSRSVRWKGIRDQGVLVELAHIAAKHHPVNLSAYINRFGIVDERARIEIAKVVAQTAGSAVGDFIDRYAIRSESGRAEVAFVVAAHTAYGISGSIRNFKILDDQIRYQVALTAAKRNGEDFSRWLENFTISDPTQLFELAKVTVSHLEKGADGSLRPARNRTSRHIEKFGLTLEQRIEVARLASEMPRSDLAEFITLFKIPSEKTRFELAKTSFEKNPVFAIEHIQRFHIEDHASRVDLARIALRTDSSRLTRSIELFDIRDSAVRTELALACAAEWPTSVAEAITSFDIADASVKLEIARRAMLVDPVRCLPTIINKFDLPKNQLLDEVIDQGFKSIGDIYATSVPSANATRAYGIYTSNFRQLLTSPDALAAIGLDPDEALSLEPHERMRAFVGYLQKHVPQFDGSLGAFLNEIQAEELLPGALAATLLTWNSCDLTRYPNRARAALARITGYDLPTGKLSPNGAREMWGTLFTAHDLLGQAPSISLPATFEDRSQTLRFITLGSSVVGLGGTIPSYTAPVSGKQIGGEIAALETKLEQTFAQQIGIARLAPGSLPQLLARWGDDVTPFSVLAARFRRYPDWQKELPVLGTIAANVLDGTFHDKRYGRIDDQLACLDARQLEVWRENPTSLRLHSVAANEADARVTTRQNVRAVFESNVLMHLPEEIAAQVTPASPADVTRFVGLTERERARERLSLGDVVGLLRTALESSSEEELKLTVTAINGLKQSLLRPVAEGSPMVARQISEDLNTLKDLFRTRQGTAGQSYYVFSTITDDPKLLLMTGDLVQSASCQNYRSGSMIGTLPGYVIDGNIKLSLSYVIKKQAFDNALAELGLAPDSPCHVTFDAPRQSLILTPGVDDPSKRATVRLGFAMRRQILRLGQHEKTGKPVLLTEGPYLQPHPIDAQLSQQHRELITTVRGAIGAQEPDKSFTTIFPASRNPGGVYSDECRGTKIGSYTHRPLS